MKIAIVGTGISGLGAAYLLDQSHDITVFEKNDYLGGHSRTVDISTGDETLSVDTGFIVFNYRNYPNLTAMFKQLGVPIAKSDMSFGVSIADAWLEYGTKAPLDLFAQKQNIVRPQFWKMLLDILKFNRNAHRYLDSKKELTLGQYLDDMGLGAWFTHYYLLAMGSSIWSMPLAEMLNFPAQSFIRFFHNHGLLTVNDQPQWYTVQGGSKAYVSRLTESYRDKVRLNCGVEKVTRHAKGVELTDTDGNTHTFDQVVLACHSDQALKMLQAPSAEEKAVLGKIGYQSNEVVLHSDESFMPKRRKAWSSWVYLSESREDQSPRVNLSYWMNNLQPLGTSKPIIVTLNPSRQPEPAKVYDRHSFSHPVFDGQAIKAQSQIARIQGKNNIWFCGAWQKYGFHEDGLQSAVNVAQAMGIKIPWH